LKIAYIVERFPSLSQTFILNQIAGMLDLEHNVKILASKEGDKSVLHSEVIQYNLLEKTEYLLQDMPPNIFLRYSKCGSYIINNRSHIVNLLRSLNIIEFKKRALNLSLFYSLAVLLSSGREHYDIVHSQFGTTGIQTMMLRRFGILQGKLLVSIRGRDICRNVKEEKANYTKLFKSADLMLPVSNYFKKKLIDLGCEESKIVVHHSGINLKKLSFKSRIINSGDVIKIVTVGRLEEKKGIEYGLKALKMVLEENGNVVYKIVGDGKLKSYLQNLACQLGIREKVIFYGKQNHDAIAQILNDSHVFIAPSVTAKDGDQEGIPNVLKEAMALGMPVVSTYHSGIPELVEDGVSGFLVEEKKVSDLANKIKYLIDKPDIWDYMGREGRKVIEKAFDSEKLNRALENMYSQLLVQENSF